MRFMCLVSGATGRVGQDSKRLVPTSSFQHFASCVRMSFFLLLDLPVTPPDQVGSSSMDS